MKYLAIDVGGTFTKYAVMDDKCEFYEKGKVPTISDTEDNFIKMLVQIYENNKDGIEGIAISSAGIIDSQNGIMHTGGSLFCISELHLVEKMKDYCNVSVTIENDAKCAGMAEIWKGSLKGCRSAVVMILGTAVGGAIILDGKVLKGSHLMAGEFSYLFKDSKDALNPENTLAKKGGVGVLKELAAKQGLKSIKMSAEYIFNEAEAGNEKTLNTVREYAHILAVQIMNYQFMTDPEKIAIGGGVSVRTLLLDMIREELVKLSQVYPHKVPIPKVTACRFFNDSNLIGALYVHLKQTKKI